MKTKLIIIAFLTGFLLSCSSSDDGAPSTDNGIPATSFPITTNNTWNYNVENAASATTPASSASDILYVGDEIEINAIRYKEMRTTEVVANGFFSSTLKDNRIRIDGNKVRVTGEFTFSAGLPSPLSFSVSDFIILKENAAVNEGLSTVTGSFTQDFNGTPLVFDYVLSSVADGSQNSFSSNGLTYADITKTKVILNLKITTIFGIFPVTVMPSQNVLISNQYYSKNIGMVYNLTNINYVLNTLPAGFQLPIPQTGSQMQEEFLESYLLN